MIRFTIGQRVVLRDRRTGVIVPHETKVESADLRQVTVQWFGETNSHGGSNYIAKFHGWTLQNLYPSESSLELVINYSDPEKPRAEEVANVTTDR